MRGRRGTNSHPPSFCVAGVALMALGGALGLAWSPVTPGTPRHLAWQAWHKLTSTVVLRSRRGTTSHPPSFCVAGVALMALGGALGLAWSPVTPGTPRHFAWQAWHNLTSTVVLRGRRGTHGTGWRAWTGLVARDARDAAALCVAGVAQTHIHRRFAWQAWHLRGRRGTHGTGWRAWTGLVARDARDAAALCVAGVAQTHIYRRFAWQAWHKLTSIVVLRGRRGTHGTGWRAWTGLVARDARDAAALCVAGVAQTHIHRRFAWQAWHLRGRRGAHGTGWRAWTGLVARDARDAAALCVAGVAQPHIHRRFAWQAWHKLTSTVVLRGRRGTHGTGWRAWTGLVARDAAALCVAGVAQTHIHRRFAWQAWHLRGRRGTHGTGWRAWTGLVARDAAALCVAGVAQTHIHRRFAWQDKDMVVFRRPRLSQLVPSNGSDIVLKLITSNEPPPVNIRVVIGKAAATSATYRPQPSTSPLYDFCELQTLMLRNLDRVPLRDVDLRCPDGPLAKRLRQRFYEMLQCNVKLGKRTLSEFRADESTSTYYLHVLVSSDAQRMTLRAKLLYDPVYLRVPVVEDGKVCP